MPSCLNIAVNSRCIRIIGAALLISCLSSTAAFAGKPGKLKIWGNVRGQYIYQDNRDFGTGSLQTTDDFGTDARLYLRYNVTEDLTFFTEGWAFVGISDDPVDDTGTSTLSDDGTDSFVAIRRLQFDLENLFGETTPFSMTVGRQRIREPRALWYNRDTDAVRLNYKTDDVNGFLAVAHNFSDYRFGDDDFEKEDEDRLRLIAEGVWEYKPEHFWELRAFYEDDSSGLESLGQSVRADDVDDEDFNLFWAGLRARGTLEPENHVPGGMTKLSYHAEILGVTGQADSITTSPTADPSVRTVSSVADRDVNAWAFDGLVNFTLDLPKDPVLTLGYAYGSGDDDPTDNDDTAFRQTDLEGNSSRYYEGAATAIRNYGEAFRPELSNIHILTVGAGLPVTDTVDVNAVYHYYRLAEEEGSLRDDGVSAALNGTDADLGHGFDITTHIDLSKEVKFFSRGKKDYPRKTRAKLTVGAFQSGDAYGPAGNDETTWRVVGQIKFHF